MAAGSNSKLLLSGKGLCYLVSTNKNNSFVISICIKVHMTVLFGGPQQWAKQQTSHRIQKRTGLEHHGKVFFSNFPFGKVDIYDIYVPVSAVILRHMWRTTRKRAGDLKGKQKDRPPVWTFAKLHGNSKHTKMMHVYIYYIYKHTCQSFTFTCTFNTNMYWLARRWICWIKVLW